MILKEMMNESSRSRPLRAPAMKIYTASKISHAQMWRQLRAEHPYHHFTASWPDLIALNLESEKSPLVFRDAWEQNIREVLEADILLLYFHESERLEGALVEVGAALAAGKRVHIISSTPEALGTWKHHPLVTHWMMPIPVFLRHLKAGERE